MSGTAVFAISGVMRYILVALVFALSVSVAQADTSSSSESKNSKYYGNCVVTTTIDMFTDTETHGFVCGEETLTDETTVMVLTDPKSGLAMFLSKGVQFHLDHSIDVRIRIDKGELIKRQAKWFNSKYALISDAQLVHRLLNELAHGQRVAIQVGDERGNIRLNGSGKAAADFRRRAGLTQQDLTPQEHQVLEIPAKSF